MRKKHMIAIAALLLAYGPAMRLQTAAQTAPPATKPAPPPLGPVVSYQYWPMQYIQFVSGPELPYSMFMFEANTDVKPAVYHAAFTAKDGTTTNYSSTDALAGYYKATGAPSYKTNFAVESDESDKVGATTTVRFSTFDEKPVEFRFVQGSDISEQGSGLQPIPESPVPVFAYRELGALAGEGTALKVGDTVSTAEVWKEYAHPPYFVPYRGAVTSSAHLLVLPKLSLTWTVKQYPVALATGNTWEMDEARGNHISLRIEKVEGSRYTMLVSDRYHPELRKTLTATRNRDTWSLERLTYQTAAKGGDKHVATLTFTPGLGTSNGTSGTMDLSVAKKQKIVSAAWTTAADVANVQFTMPAWTNKLSIAEEMKVSGDTVTQAAH